MKLSRSLFFWGHLTMRAKKPIIDAALLEIVHHEVRAFTGRAPLRKSGAGTQAAIVDDLVSAGAAALIRAAEHFGTAVAMGHQDAIQLKNMLVGLLAGVEKQLAAAAQANVSGTAGIGEKVLNS